MKNFKEIPTLTEKAFKELCDGSSKSLKEIFEIKSKLELSDANPSVIEMFWSDFSVEWNKHQSSYFIKENVLLDTGKKIPYFPSQWIGEWKDSLSKQDFIKNIDEVFDFRTFSFEQYQSNVDKLKVIFSKVFKVTDKDFKSCQNIQSNMLEAYLYNADKQSNQKALMYMIYIGATFEYFNKVILKDPKKVKDLVEFVVEFHYGKQNTKKNKEIELLFQTYIPGSKNIDEQKKKMFDLKESSLSFRDEDANYWRYYLSVIPNELFLESLKENFDVKSFQKNSGELGSVSMTMFAKNNYELLNKELPIKKQNVFVNKKIKI